MKEWVALIVAVLVQVLAAVLAKRSQPTAEDARRQTDLRDRLQRKVRERWNRP